MNSLALKIIAMTCMLLDHIAVIFFPNGEAGWLRIIGRIAFPLYCFLIVEGCFYTSNIKKYMLRLLTFAIISEIPYNLAFYNTFFTLDIRNVLYELFLGVLAIYICNKKSDTPLLKNIPFANFIIFITIMIIATIVKTEYHFWGIALIFVFYQFRDNIFAKNIGVTVLSLCGGGNQIFVMLSLLFINLYNRKPGYSNKFIKLFFYIFYPTHIALLYVLSTMF